eukprot:241309-Pyramimonas_sp.AAC.1
MVRVGGLQYRETLKRKECGKRDRALAWNMAQKSEDCCAGLKEGPQLEPRCCQGGCPRPRQQGCTLGAHPGVPRRLQDAPLGAPRDPARAPRGPQEGPRPSVCNAELAHAWFQVPSDFSR